MYDFELFKHAKYLLKIRYGTLFSMLKYLTKSGIISILITSTVACTSVYYDTLEKVGVHKRDILIDRIEDTQDSQQEGREQFTSALDQFKSIVNVNPSNLEEQYDELDATYNKSLDAASDIRSNIKKVESVSQALFAEWKEEINSYANQTLKTDSQKKLNQTEAQYKDLISVLKNSESKLSPVLGMMHDRVLYLKHNLNASAMGSLENELGQIDTDITQLIESMKQSINEADDFIKSIRG